MSSAQIDCEIEDPDSRVPIHRSGRVGEVEHISDATLDLARAGFAISEGFPLRALT